MLPEACAGMRIGKAGGRQGHAWPAWSGTCVRGRAARQGDARHHGSCAEWARECGSSADCDDPNGGFPVIRRGGCWRVAS